MEEAIKFARRAIENTRQMNNSLFMDWWEVSMSCPHCRETAMAYQHLIRSNDKFITDLNGNLLREMEKCRSGA